MSDSSAYDTCTRDWANTMLSNQQQVVIVKQEAPDEVCQNGQESCNRSIS